MATNSDSRCQYRKSDGKRCRSLRAVDHPHYCAHHARSSSEGVLEDPEQLTTDIFGAEIDFSDARALNRAAGKLLICFLSGRIPARHAAVAGYLCQLLIHTLPQIERQERPAPERIQYELVHNVPRPDYSAQAARYQAERELRLQKEAALAAQQPQRNQP